MVSLRLFFKILTITVLHLLHSTFIFPSLFLNPVTTLPQFTQCQINGRHSLFTVIVSLSCSFRWFRSTSHFYRTHLRHSALVFIYSSINLNSFLPSLILNTGSVTTLVVSHNDLTVRPQVMHSIQPPVSSKFTL